MAHNTMKVMKVREIWPEALGEPVGYIAKCHSPEDATYTYKYINIYLTAEGLKCMHVCVVQ